MPIVPVFDPSTGANGGPPSAGGGADPSVSSSLGDTVDTTSPYSFAPTLTVSAGATVATTITRMSDGSSVTVTDPTTTTPTATLTAADATVGDSFRCASVATDGSYTDEHVTVVFMEGTGNSTVTPPSPTSEAVAAGGSAADKTFSAFTDADGVIDHYGHEIVDAVGTVTATDGGSDNTLGPWSFSGETDGDSFALILTAYDASGNPLASAVHQVDIAAPSADSIVTAPAATSEAVAAGGSLSAKTFGAFTDPDGVIDNYVATVENASGSAAVSGSGLGPYTFSGTADGDAGTLYLTARDTSDNHLATAVHSFAIEFAVTDLTAPDDPNPSQVTNTTAGVTSKSLGSWSASVTVTGSGKYSDGSAAPSPSISGSGAGPYSYTVTGLAADSVAHYEFSGEAADGQVAKVGDAIVTGNPGPIEFSDVTTYDYTSDNDTTVTITVGGGDTTLREADQTSAKGVVFAVNRVHSPTTSITVASDGIDIDVQRNTGNAERMTYTQKATASDADLSDGGKICVIDAVVQDIALTSTDSGIFILLSDSSAPFGTDNSLGVQVRLRSGATEYRLGRVVGGSANLSGYTSGAGSITSIAVRWIVSGDRILTMLWQLNATSPITVYKAGGSVLDEDSAGSPGTVGYVTLSNPDPWYVHYEYGVDNASAQAVGRVSHFATEELDYT